MHGQEEHRTTKWQGSMHCMLLLHRHTVYTYMYMYNYMDRRLFQNYLNRRYLFSTGICKSCLVFINPNWEIDKC